MEKRVHKWLDELFGLSGSLKRLSGYDDINFEMDSSSDMKYVVKISAFEVGYENLLAQNKILEHLKIRSDSPSSFPQVIATNDGQTIAQVSDGSTSYFIRLLTFLPGTPMAAMPGSNELYEALGKFLGNLGHCLGTLEIPELCAKHSAWDLQYADDCLKFSKEIVDPHYQRLVHYFIQQYQHQVIPMFRVLPKGIIHGDANDHNLLIDNNSISGLIDFGDATYSYQINELAIAVTYCMLSSTNPIEAAVRVASGYHAVRKISRKELELLYYLVGARLSVSLCFSSHGQIEDPGNHYIKLHQQPVKEMMDKLISINPLLFEYKVKSACGYPVTNLTHSTSLLATRKRFINDSLSVSYEQPISINRGALQYLYDDQGKTYLDAVNNISHVGHCHPQIVTAANNQSARLNTNTRYLYRHLNEYAEALCKLLPEPLTTVFLVNSGSEANELALRLARNHTKKQGMVVIEGAYHGNSSATLEVSPYKYNSPGGSGKQSFIHELPMPDLYCGKFRDDNPAAVDQYLTQQLSIIENASNGPDGLAGFIGESLLGCGGQVLLPPGYLKGTYEQIRKSGGICIADEVQVGFGRVGSHFWGFQVHEVVPDIVTMGKPMGNGHPLAAVVTTKNVAQSFENGLEYFNSFGGNPVSCEIGLAVLSVLEQEKLQENARVIGQYLKLGLEALMDLHPVIGEVRGLGLFLGVCIVDNQDLRTPNPSVAKRLVESMKERGVLLSTDGPMNNVIKIKPPLVLSKDNADLIVSLLDQSIKNLNHD